jgi:hypothetical protein
MVGRTCPSARRAPPALAFQNIRCSMLGVRRSMFDVQCSNFLGSHALRPSTGMIVRRYKPSEDDSPSPASGRSVAKTDGGEGESFERECSTARGKPRTRSAAVCGAKGHQLQHAVGSGPYVFKSRSCNACCNPESFRGATLGRSALSCRRMINSFTTNRNLSLRTNVISRKPLI